MTELEVLQEKQWNECDNYEIIMSAQSMDTVAIYFTSNDLFYPHDVEHFKWSVLEKDYYEWKNYLIKRASKHIFVRDIYKQWYAKGINKKIPSIDALLVMLKKETEEYKEIICVGSSAGGYMASLIGSPLNADICFSFNGQWNIWNSIKNGNVVISPILQQAVDEKDEDVFRYFDLCEWIQSNLNIFYFRSCFCEWDVQQSHHIEKLMNIHVISFKTAHHGIPFLKSSLGDVLNMDKNALLKMDRKQYNPIPFSVMHGGLFHTIIGVYWQLQRKLEKIRNE